MNDKKIKIPKYISSFDLEQARLGQAMQTAKLDYRNYLLILEDPDFLKQILIKIRDESVNAEWALKNISETNLIKSSLNTSVIHDATLNLIKILLKKKKNYN